MSIYPRKWIAKYQRRGAFWIHDGNLRRPHICLPSDKHTNGFFDDQLVIPDDFLMRSAACDLLSLFLLFSYVHEFDGVVPQTGATKLAKCLCDVQQRRGMQQPTFFTSPARHDEGGVKSMVFSPEEARQVKGKSVLLCEDTVSTGGSIELTADAIVRAGGTVLPFICTLVNRSGQEFINGRRVVSLINHAMPIWEPDECPLCQAGSEAISAKHPPSNWELLNAEYEAA